MRRSWCIAPPYRRAPVRRRRKPRPRSPGARQAQEKAKAAADIVRTYLTRWKIQRLYSDTFDLAHDEL
ncbi:CsgE family curli-type amyloid fiber assembly protein [Vibrio fluvialis]|uniref:CsgE family curli-type amyloid fiber assembly protein n=1 Tax=Vibrio fluvialis TaxID=676 RepID=UPI003BAF6B44